MTPTGNHIQDIARILADAILRIEARKSGKEATDPENRANSMLSEKNPLDFTEKQSVHTTVQRQHAKGDGQ